MSKKIKIEIKSWLNGSVLFSYETEDNTVAKTVGEANLRGADLRGADLYGADLRGADLREADLREADLYGADLYGADLRGQTLERLPREFINSCSRDMLFIMEHLKAEVPTLKAKLLAGEVNGSQYEGECSCLVGTLGAADGGVDAVCEMIPYYTRGTHNPGEQWFLSIHEGDKPADNDFSKHAVELCNMVLGLPIDDGLKAPTAKTAKKST